MEPYKQSGFMPFGVSVMVPAAYFVWRANAVLFVLLGCCFLAGPAQSEVSVTIGELTFRYSSGTVQMSEVYGPQIIDAENVVVSSQSGEQFTADSLVLKANGTMQSLDWIEKIEILNLRLTSPASTEHKFQLESALLVGENIHLEQPEALRKLAERLDKDRNRPTFLKLNGFVLILPEDGLIVEIDEFLADGNPDLINSQLPPGQHVGEVNLENARLLPSGSGETSMMFRFMLSGLGLDAVRLDGRASSLSKFSTGQVEGELRLELDVDRLVGLDFGVDTSVDDQLYQTLIQAEKGEKPDTPDEQQAALMARLFSNLSISLRDSGVLRIYDSLASGFGLPNRRELALMTEYHLSDRLKGAARLAVVPVTDFIRAGGSLTLSAQPDALTADDFTADEDSFLQNIIDRAEIDLKHIP